MISSEIQPSPRTALKVKSRNKDLSKYGGTFGDWSSSWVNFLGLGIFWIFVVSKWHKFYAALTTPNPNNGTLSGTKSLKSITFWIYRMLLFIISMPHSKLINILGGFAFVFHAQELSSNKEFALKVSFPISLLFKKKNFFYILRNKTRTPNQRSKRFLFCNFFK